MDETTAFIRGEEVLLDGSVRRYGGTNFSESVKEAHDSSKASIQSRISNLESGGVKGTGETKGFKFSSETYSHVEYQGRRVYQRNDIDWKMVDPNTGLSNLERAQMGWAPLGKDGKTINLHHILQQEPGPMVEILQTVHRKNYRILHGLLEKNKFKRIKPLDKISLKANKFIDEIVEIRKERKRIKRRSFRSDPELDKQYNDFREQYWKWRSDEYVKKFDI
ncbi:HNH/ENDO VII family nuclease [Bacillus cereus group sp. MS39]|uniref:HNH/ENDO VII family nuclease n=1 Tax=Bacillus cereus group sp. MS39 TaxID=3041344 RepID=A0AAU8FBH5_9BACI